MDCTFCNIRDFFDKGSYYKQEKTLIRYNYQHIKLPIISN